jgi:hypothetical protein
MRGNSRIERQKGSSRVYLLRLLVLQGTEGNRQGLEGSGSK